MKIKPVILCGGAGTRLWPESKNNTPKQFLNLDLVMTEGSDDLKTYINVNKPFSGIVQERPVFSNINNGVGLFSSRFTYDDIKGIELTNGTINYMINDLDLGFE